MALAASGFGLWQVIPPLGVRMDYRLNGGNGVYCRNGVQLCLIMGMVLYYPGEHVDCSGVVYGVA